MFEQLEESGCESMLGKLGSICTELEMTRARRREALATLQAKKEQIEQFAETTVSCVGCTAP